LNRPRFPICFTVVSLALVATLVPDAFLRGEVLTQASLLYRYLPWQPYAPPNLHTPNTLLSDPALVFYPFLMHTVQSVHSWQLPRWSSAIYGGHPFLGSFQTAVFSPFTTIAFVVPLPRATVFIALAPLVVGGLGMFLFVRSLRLSAPAAWFAGLAYLLNGFAVAWMEHPLAAVACWVPWLLLATDSLVKWPDAPRVVSLAVMVSLVIFSGHPETAAKVLLLGGAYAALVLTMERNSHWYPTALAYGAGVLVASIQILPFLEYLAHSEALVSREAHSINRSFMPAATIMAALVPDFFGNPAHGSYLVRVNRFGGESNYAEQAIYAGIAVVLLAPVGFISRRHEWRVRFFAVCSLVSLALMYGIPGVLQTVSMIPFVRVMILSRFGLIVIVSLIVLAAYGVDTLTRDTNVQAQRVRRTMLAVASTAIVVIGISYLATLEFLRAHGQSGRTAAASLIAVALLLVVAGVILLRVRRTVSSNWYAVASCSVLAADLVVVGSRFHPTVPAGQVYPALPELEWIRRDPDLFRVYGWGSVLAPNSAMAYRLQDVRGWDGLNPSRYTRLLDLGYLRQSSDPERHLRNPTLLDLLNVKYVFVGPGVSLSPPRYVPAANSRVPLYVNMRAFPRAFLVDRYQVLTDSELMETLHDGSVDLARVALLETDLPAGERPDPARTESALGNVHVRHYRDTFAELDVESSRRTLLVMSDAHYPGWVATVDGMPVTIRRADFALRAVAIPSGKHIVRFEYRPLSICMGAVLSGSTIVGLVAAVITWVRQRRK